MSLVDIAYSYIRFSHRKQEEGDSIRRQSEGASGWAKRNSVPLDESLAPDRGLSAFKGRNRDLGALGEFLRLVESGRVKPGSYLVVEALDRLTREEIQPAMLLVLSLLQKGIRVVQLKPAEMVYDAKSDTTAIILMLVELSRGHSESKVKSERLTASWDQRKKLAREGKLVITKRIPAWLEKQGNKVVEVPERVKVVRQIFDLAIGGYGLSLIVRQLEAEKVPPLLSAERWRRSYISKILNRRLVLGEYQPEKNGVVDGPPIVGYYPQVIAPETWERAQKALASRRGKGGPTGKRVANLFAGVLWDARSQTRIYITWRDRGSEPRRKNSPRVRMLRPSGPMESYGRAVMFPNQVFEDALLSFLKKEIRADDVTGVEQKSETAELEADLANLDMRLKALEAELLDGDVGAIARSLRALESRRRELVTALTEARRAQDTPLAGVWAEAKTLLDLADRDEPMRLRLKALLANAIREVWVLLWRQKKSTTCLAQVFFRSEFRRMLQIEYRSATRTREAEWSARTCGGTLESLDLRNAQDVSEVTKALAESD